MTTVHLITLDSLLSRPLFEEPEGARAIGRLHRQPLLWKSSRCLAWVLMPDRWRAIVEIGAGDSTLALVRRFKNASTRAVAPALRVNGWLWARGFSEALLADSEDLQALARDLVSAPVRNGLVSSVGAYPYWDAIWLDAPPRAKAA